MLTCFFTCALYRTLMAFCDESLLLHAQMKVSRYSGGTFLLPPPIDLHAASRYCMASPQRPPQLLGRRDAREHIVGDATRKKCEASIIDELFVSARKHEMLFAPLPSIGVCDAACFISLFSAKTSYNSIDVCSIELFFVLGKRVYTKNFLLTSMVCFFCSSFARLLAKTC
jgi:hypothetical protein